MPTNHPNEYDNTVRILDNRDLRFGGTAGTGGSGGDDIVFVHDATAQTVTAKDQSTNILMSWGQSFVNFYKDLKHSFGTQSGNHIYMKYNSSTDRLEFRNDTDGLLFSIGRADLTAYFNYSALNNTMDSDNAILETYQSNKDAITYHVKRLIKGAHGGGTASIVTSGSIISEEEVQGYDGATFQQLCRLTFEVDGTPGVGDMPGCIKLWTTPSGSATSVLRVKVGEDGTVAISNDATIAGTLGVAGNTTLSTFTATGTATITGLLTLTAGITGMFITNGGRRKNTVNTGTGTYTVLSTDHVLRCPTALGAVQLDLEASPGDGRTLTIKDKDGNASINNITVNPLSGNIDGAGSFVINWNYGAVTLFWGGTNWFIVDKPNLSGGVSDGDKGDITVTASGATWTIDPDTVTYDKMQDTSGTDIILGRSTAGAGTIEEIPCTSAGRALLDDADASAQRTTLGLGFLATKGNGNYGDITVSATGNTWSLNNDVVTYAKMQDTSSGDVILGVAGVAGEITEISCTDKGRAILDDATFADMRSTIGLNNTLGVAIQFFCSEFNPTDSNSYYVGAVPLAPSGTSDDYAVPIGTSLGGTIKRAQIKWRASGVAGSNESISVDLYLAGSLTAHTINSVADTNAEKNFGNSSMSVTVGNTERLEIRITTPSWTTNPTGVSIWGMVWMDFD